MDVPGEQRGNSVKVIGYWGRSVVGCVGGMHVKSLVIEKDGFLEGVVGVWYLGCWRGYEIRPGGPQRRGTDLKGKLGHWSLVRVVVDWI